MKYSIYIDEETIYISFPKLRVGCYITHRIHTLCLTLAETGYSREYDPVAARFIQLNNLNEL